MRAFLQGRWLRHPLHPILIHFPIGLLILSLVLDFLSLTLQDGGVYLEASLYTMTGAVAAAALAAVAGVADLTSIRRDSRSFRVGLLHLTIMVLVIAAFAVNLWLRWDRWGVDGFATDDRVSAWALLFSLVGVGLLGAGSWLGGRLVYGDGIGVGRHRRTAPLPCRTVSVTSPPEGDGFVTVAREEELGEGQTLRAEVDGTVMTLVRAGGDVYALGEFCTHRFGPLSEGPVHDCQIECPWHRSEFDVRTGEVTRGPAKQPVSTFPVRVEDGEIRVSGRAQGASLPEPSPPGGQSPDAATAESREERQADD